MSWIFCFGWMSQRSRMTGEEGPEDVVDILQPFQTLPYGEFTID